MPQWVTGDQVSGNLDPNTGSVKIGTKYNATQPTYTDGHRADFQTDARGVLKVVLFNQANSMVVNSGNSDGIAGQSGLATAADIAGWNGTGWDRVRTTSAGNLSATPQLGAVLTALPGQWSVVHLPATNTQATASKAAVASTRHVATALTATLASGSTAITVPATPVNVVIRDGATGAGTIIWQSYISAITTAGSFASIALSGLNLVGSVNTAMTVEFSAAGGVGTFESVSLQGYSVT